MARELLRLRESLVNTPHLVHPMTFKTVIDYLDARNSDPSMIEDDDEDGVSNSRYSYNEDSKVALLNVDGPLTYRPVHMLCGGNSGTNYQTLKSDFLDLAEAGAKTIALYVNRQHRKSVFHRDDPRTIFERKQRFIAFVSCPLRENKDRIPFR